MYLLYVDESGQHGGNYFVLAGIAVFERRTYWIATELDRVQKEFLPEVAGPVAFHVSAIRAGREPPWDGLDQETRYRILDSLYSVIGESRSTLFAVAIERQWLSGGEDEYLYAFESLIRRFDSFLGRMYKQDAERQRGLLIIAESEFRRRIESLALKVMSEGTRWGELYNLAEVPLFTLARNSRLLQAADACANAVFGRYEGGFSRHFDTLAHRFDSEGGAVHGLAHFSRTYETCGCPGCLSRRLVSAS